MCVFVCEFALLLFVSFFGYKIFIFFDDFQPTKENDKKKIGEITIEKQRMRQMKRKKMEEKKRREIKTMEKG